jgi:predicted benzoate:H+ symporter BenE
VSLEIVVHLVPSQDHCIKQLLDNGYHVLVSDSTSLMKYTGLWTGKACPSSCLSTTMAAMTTWVVAGTYR